jgi:hypothetical protein
MSLDNDNLLVFGNKVRLDILGIIPEIWLPLAHLINLKFVTWNNLTR